MGYEEIENNLALQPMNEPVYRLKKTDFGADDRLLFQGLSGRSGEKYSWNLPEDVYARKSMDEILISLQFALFWIRSRIATPLWE